MKKAKTKKSTVVTKPKKNALSKKHASILKDTLLGIIIKEIS